MLRFTFAHCASIAKAIHVRVRVSRVALFTLISVFLLTIMALPGVGLAQVTQFSVPDRTYVTDGVVRTVVRSGNTIYIAGTFSRVGPRTGPGLEFAPGGSQNPGLPEVSGGTDTVNAVASDGSGGWYIGGLFTHVGGIARRNIAHIRADRSVDPAFDPSADGAIRAMVVSADGLTVYVSGLFTSIGGQTRNRIAGLNAVNGSATAFDPNPVGTRVEALAISGSIVYAGGNFTSIGGQLRNRIAALNVADGSATLTFNPNASNTVRALAISGSTLYVGGGFATIGGQTRSNVAALTLGGVLDGTATSFSADTATGTCLPCGTVFALAVSSSAVYVGGTFNIIGGQTRTGLAGLDPTSGIPTSFNPAPTGNISALAVSVDGLTVYAGGGIRTIGGQPRNFLAALNAADGTATTFNPNPNNAAVAIGVSASAVYVGGSFTSLGGVVRNSIAALNAADGTATSFGPACSSANGSATVNALAVSADGATVYVGGFFASCGGQPRNSLAALNAADGTATTWIPLANNIVNAITLSGPLMYVGGNFTSIGGQPRNRIAALGLSDGLATAFDPNAIDGGVSALVVSGPLLYAGGQFTLIGGQTRRSLAALNLSDGTATAWNPDIVLTAGNSQIFTIAVSGSTIYAGGLFSTVQGLNRKNIAAVSAADGAPTGFDPQAIGAPFSDAVNAIALSGSKVYAAGRFQTIGGQPRNLVAELNPSDGSATSFNPGAAGGVSADALAVALNGTLYVGGAFKTFELASQQGFASFANLSPTFVSVSGRVMTPDGRGLTNARLTMTDSNLVARQAISSSFGYYRFEDVRAGETYTISVSSKRYQFTSRVISVVDASLSDIDFVPDPGFGSKP